jgi:hypothetical protein
VLLRSTPIGLLTFVAVVGCGPKSDPVRQALDRIVAAAKDRDAAELVESLTLDFQAADGTGRADAEATLRRYLAAYEQLDVRISDVTIERAIGAARARFRAELSGKPRNIGGLEGLVPRTSTYRFDLRLSPDSNGRWLVTSAGWEETARPGFSGRL